MTAISVSLKHLYKTYPGANTPAVENFCLDVAESEFVVLVGHSGCGKSTVLRMIAGLEAPTEGEVWIGGQLCNNLDPKDRDIAMVFQSYALYPHMTVRENLEFGLKLARRMTKGEIDARVLEAAETLGIRPMLERKPRHLSGGERQRVALGRAIVRKPRVFLFDEPLSNLDANMRAQMRVELGKLHGRLQTTMIYVTHDQIEAMTMGDRIVCMQGVRTQQIGSPMEMYNHPGNEYVGAFIGSPPMNFVTLDVVDKTMKICGTEVVLHPTPSMLAATQGLPGVRMGIRPEHLAFSSESAFSIPAVVQVVEPLGFETLVYVGCGEVTFIVRIQESRVPEVGEHVFLAPVENHLHWFDPATGLRLAGTGG
jgi:multiple sugar transport system ATP-binding protein